MIVWLVDQQVFENVHIIKQEKLDWMIDNWLIGWLIHLTIYWLIDWVIVMYSPIVTMYVDGNIGKEYYY